MRAKDFLPETWFNDLDQNTQQMMGYGPENNEEAEQKPDLKATVRQIRRQRDAVPKVVAKAA